MIYEAKVAPAPDLLLVPLDAVLFLQLQSPFLQSRSLSTEVLCHTGHIIHLHVIQ